MERSTLRFNWIWNKVKEPRKASKETKKTDQIRCIFDSQDLQRAPCFSQHKVIAGVKIAFAQVNLLALHLPKSAAIIPPTARLQEGK